MYNCCQCFKEIVDSNPAKCDSCTLPLHLKCLSLSEEEFKLLSGPRSRNIKLVCSRCVVSLNATSEIKSLISELKTSIETRLSNLEASLKSPMSVAPTQSENIIQESVNRAIRASNVIMANVPEDSETPDIKVVNDILEKIDPNAFAYPEDVCRIGRITTPNKPRLIKIKFRKIETAKLVLRKSSTLKQIPELKNVSIRSDKTPMQITYFKNIKTELKQRLDEGERNLKIKYINGVPQIVANSTQDSIHNLN